MIWRASLAAALVVTLAGLGVGMALGGPTPARSRSTPGVRTTTTTETATMSVTVGVTTALTKVSVTTATVTRTAVRTAVITTTATTTLTVATPDVPPGDVAASQPFTTQVSGYVAQFGAFRRLAGARSLSTSLTRRGVWTQIVSSNKYYTTPPAGSGLWLVVSRAFASLDDAQAYADGSGVAGAFARTLMPIM